MKKWRSCGKKEVKERKGGQRKKGRSKREREVKLRNGGQIKKWRSKEEMEVKWRRGGQRKKWSPKRTWKERVEEESVKVDFRRENAIARSKWCAGVNHIDTGLG